MTPKTRATVALQGGVPDRIPTFELEFQLVPELLGRPSITQTEVDAADGPAARDRLIAAAAEDAVSVVERLEYDIAPMGRFWRPEDLLAYVRRLDELVGTTHLIAAHGDSTLSIGDAARMQTLVMRILDQPDDLIAEQDRAVDARLDDCARLVDAGVTVFMNCADYCFNSGPFISPSMFAEFVTPFLTRLQLGQRALGALVVKHTDGNIMPILDQLADSGAHALHSLDPMAGVDIAEVKRLVGHRLALCGNVNCALLQTGTPQEIVASAEYCLRHARANGGYLFTTSNVPFAGLPLENYLLALDVWRRERDYQV